MFEKLKQVILMIWGGVITLPLQVYFGDAFWFVEDNQGGGSFFFSHQFSFCRDELAALQPSLWIIFSLFLITDLDGFHRSADADKGWLVIIHQRVLPVRASRWRCGSVCLQASLSVSQYWLADADARRRSAEYQCRPRRRSGRFSEPASCSVLIFSVVLLHRSQGPLHNKTSFPQRPNGSRGHWWVLEVLFLYITLHRRSLKLQQQRPPTSLLRGKTNYLNTPRSEMVH